MKNLFKNKYLIYLDQFSTSGMFDSPSTPAWIEIRSQLTQGVNCDRIICPLSEGHYLESSLKETQKAIELDKEYSKLSCGLAFKSELFITSQLIISTIRKNNITPNTYLHENIGNNILSKKENLQEFQKIKRLYDNQIVEITLDANKLREITRDIKADSKTIEDLIKTCKYLNTESFIGRLNDLVENKKIIIQGVHLKSGDIPHWIDLVIHQLTNTHRMNLRETKALITHIKENGFDKIPTLDIRTTLTSIITVYNKKETVSDQIDINRISTAMPVSDILLTDKKRKNEIIISGLDKKYSTKIYCGTPDDLERLIAELKMINKIAPQES